MRRLLLALTERGARRAHRLRWSVCRRAHQALANRCHAARRAREQAGPPVLPAPTPTPVELTEAEWAVVRPLLPPQRPRTGRPRHDHRAVLGGILWVVRNGASWRDLPLRFGKWERAYRRYRLWSDTGLWERLLATLRGVSGDVLTEVSL